MFRKSKEKTDVQKAKDAREQKRLALFLHPKPPTPPLAKRPPRTSASGNQALNKEGEALRSKNYESSSESDSTTDSSSSGSDTSSSSSDENGEAPTPETPRTLTLPSALATPQQQQRLSQDVQQTMSAPQLPGPRPPASREIVYLLGQPGPSKESEKKKKGKSKKGSRRSKKKPCLVHGDPNQASKPPCKVHSRPEATTTTQPESQCDVAAPFLWFCSLIKDIKDKYFQ
ncbi:proteoglycan 4-like isoform X2 [Ornithodoros turicata]|uniref:proteoglycan 4-like isoform X2 n=1 Tax=Ornithodoros turicata TaxID=34597 RepID=UPI0031395AFA